MPRPNEPRAIYSEAGLARRLAYERQRLGMSLDGLAKRMADAGCPIHASAIYKIEKGDPPRRITVDELVAFSAVLDIPITELLLPPEAVLTSEIKALFEEWIELWNEAARQLEEVRRADERQQDAWKRLLERVNGSGREEKQAKRYFLDLMESSPLRMSKEEGEALAKAERDVDKTLRKIEAQERKAPRRG